MRDRYIAVRETLDEHRISKYDKIRIKQEQPTEPKLPQRFCKYDAVQLALRVVLKNCTGSIDYSGRYIR